MHEGIKRHLKELGEKTESFPPHHGVVLPSTTSSQARGNWGEVTSTLFEMAMSKNIDFGEQETLTDVVVRISWFASPTAE